MAALALSSVLVMMSCGDDPGEDPVQNIPTFVPVTNITGIPVQMVIGDDGELTLTGTVEPASATNKTITWAVTADEDETGAAIADGNKLTATAEGAFTVTATIANGLTESTPYTQSFEITAYTAENLPTVTDITVSPATATVAPGGTKQFTATVIGNNSPSTAVTWSVEGTGKKAGTTISNASGTAGLLTVASDETATLTVKATSLADPEKSGTATVTVAVESIGYTKDQLAGHLDTLTDNSAANPSTVIIAPMEFGDDTTDWSAIDSTIYSKEKYVILDLSYCTIPDAKLVGNNQYSPMTSPFGNIFRTTEYVIGLILPDTITAIGDYAFTGCVNLKTIEIPEDVETIGDRAFYACTSLTEITIPSIVTYIGQYAFEGCTSLTEITISEGVETIGAHAFYGCASLEAITIPSSVDSIGPLAFEGCTGLEGITIPSTVTTIGQKAFKGCASLTEITIPAGVTTIASETFRGCASIEELTIPSTVTTMKDHAFYGLSSLARVTFEGTITAQNFGDNFPGDLWEIYLGLAVDENEEPVAGGPGTYTREIPDSNPGTDGTWTKQDD
jgi:hypothetical protein